jgi:hypothetical protein
VFETPVIKIAHIDARKTYHTAHKTVSLMTNPRSSKHVGDNRNLKLNINLENYGFRLFMLYNFTTMHGAKNIKVMLNSEVTRSTLINTEFHSSNTFYTIWNTIKIKLQRVL